MEKVNTSAANQQRERKIDPGNLLMVLYMCFVVFLVLLGSLGVGNASYTRQELSEVSINDVERGELLIPTGADGRYFCSPILEQKAQIVINGMVSRTIVTQRFENPGTEWIEAKYVFPLPDESSVDGLTMVIGERKIIGQIKEKEEAKKIYQQAKEQGKKSSLLVQKRPNIFITSVANIGPGEQVEIQIEYQQKVKLTDSIFSLRFPMAITPRYQPLSKGQDQVPSLPSELSFAESGWAVTTGKENGNDEIASSHLTMQLDIQLTSGFSMARLDSLYHGISVQEKDDVHHITLDGRVKVDRDFVLEWEPKESDAAQAALFSEVQGGENYLLLMVMPPAGKDVKSTMAREMIFILDTSGSMGGESIRQAKASLEFGLNGLKPTDTFNIIEFNSEASSLFSSARPASVQNVNAARSFIAGLDAGGGTEMKNALNLALQNARYEENRLRQVIFITDGAVGNELELFQYISANLGDSRLFTVGIGSAPNSYFMSRAAAAGRGTYTYIGNTSEVMMKMGLLFEKLARPESRNITLGSGEDEIDMELYPDPIPDLYNGEPLMVSLKLPTGVKELSLSGQKDGQEWQYQIPVNSNGKNAGVAKLWARSKIRQLMDSRVLGVEEDVVKEKVVKTALQHGLVSKYTSLVAVEEKISRPENAALKEAQVKGLLPKGSKMLTAAAPLYAGGSKTATPATLYFILAVSCFALSLLSYLFSRVGRVQ